MIASWKKSWRPEVLEPGGHDARMMGLSMRMLMNDGGDED